MLKYVLTSGSFCVFWQRERRK